MAQEIKVKKISDLEIAERVEDTDLLLVDTPAGTKKIPKSNLLDDVYEDYGGLKKVIIDENASANLQDQINRTNSQIKDIVAINLKNYVGTDTEKVKRMFEDIETNHRDDYINIIIPHGEYLITEKIIIKNIKNKKIDFMGKLTFDNCDGIEFLNIENCEINISSIVGNSNISISNLDSQNYNGVKIINSNTNNFNLKSIVGFQNGIILHGQDFSDGTVRGSYNNAINFLKIYCTNAITISDDNVGWVNENVFRGGALFCKNGIISGTEGVTEQSSSRFHGNKFENIEFEAVYGGNGITFYQARSNIITYPRFESVLENAVYIIYEGDAACMNRYITARYSLPIDKIHLNVKGLCGSVVEGDLRGSVSRAGDVMVSVANDSGGTDGVIAYKSDYNGDDCPGNSIINMYNDSYLFKYIDSNNVAKNLLYYEDKIIIETDNLLNNFQNYSDDNVSEYDKFNYRLCGNGEVMISGVIKGGTNNGKIYNLPVKYRPKKIHTFPVYGKNSIDGNKTYFIEIYPSGGIYLIGQVSNLTYLFLDGIRFNIN